MKKSSLTESLETPPDAIDFLKEGYPNNAGKIQKIELELLNEFCMDTTAHGFPRLVFYRGVFKRVWIVILVISFLVTIVHIVIQIEKYFQYEVTASYTHNEIRTVLPDVSVCLNKRHISYNSEPIKMILSSVGMNYDMAFNYSLMLWKRILREKMTTASVNESGKEYMLSRLSTRSLSFEADLVSNRASVIIICKINENNCDPIRNFTDLYDPIMYYCVIVRISEEVRRLKKYGKFLTLHIMNNNNGEMESYETKYVYPPEQYDIPAGSKVALHAPNTIPSFKYQSFMVDMGSNVKAGFNYQLVQLWRDNPYSKCIEKQSTLSVVQKTTIKYFAYSSTACLNLETQKFIFKNCGCLSEDHFVPGDLISNFSERYFCHDNINFLRNITANPLESADTIIENSYKYYFDRHSCYETKLKEWNIIKSDQLFLNKLCPNLCEAQYFYVNTVTNQDIPRSDFEANPQIVDIYNKSIERSIEYSRQLNLSSRNLRESLEFLNQIPGDYFQWSMTMSTVNLFPNSNDGVILKESQAYSLISLLADIGGIFGLWIGICILTFFELIELVVKLLFCKLKSKYM